MLDSLVRVSRRGKENHFTNNSSARHSKSICVQPAIAGSCTATAPTSKPARNMTTLDTGFLRFPFSNFRYFLTLFSKFFASFPHGTCALSVSHRYLALDGIYHPLWAAIPSNSTHREVLSKPTILDMNGSLTLSAALFQGTWSRTMVKKTLYRPQFGTLYSMTEKRCADSHCELFPLQSPLLGESLLVSFPPLNYMLKFSG